MRKGVRKVEQNTAILLYPLLRKVEQNTAILFCVLFGTTFIKGGSKGGQYS
jgi:hypothetical protein